MMKRNSLLRIKSGNKKIINESYASRTKKYSTIKHSGKQTFLLSFNQVRKPLLSVYCKPKYQISRRPIVFTTWSNNCFPVVLGWIANSNSASIVVTRTLIYKVLFTENTKNFCRKIHLNEKLLLENRKFNKNLHIFKISDLNHFSQSNLIMYEFSKSSRVQRWIYFTMLCFIMISTEITKSLKKHTTFLDIAKWHNGDLLPTHFQLYPLFLP